MRVYKWPENLAVVGAEWTVSDPVSRSMSGLTGRMYLSAAQRRRRVAVLNVEGAYGDGGGYIEALKRLLRGGIHGVRLHSRPFNLGEPVGSIVPTQTQEIDWTTGGDDLDWTTSGGALHWYSGAYYSPTPYPLDAGALANGLGVATVTGLPPSQDIARVGTFATVFNEAGTASETRLLLRPVRSNSAGNARIYTDEPFTTDGNVEFGTRETGIFLPDDMPRAVRPAWQTWQVGWSFREIFADEIAPDTFTEIDPWG